MASSREAVSEVLALTSALASASASAPLEASAEVEASGAAEALGGVEVEVASADVKAEEHLGDEIECVREALDPRSLTLIRGAQLAIKPHDHDIVGRGVVPGDG